MGQRNSSTPSSMAERSLLHVAASSEEAAAPRERFGGIHQYEEVGGTRAPRWSATLSSGASRDWPWIKLGLKLGLLLWRCPPICANFFFFFFEGTKLFAAPEISPSAHPLSILK